MTSCTPQELVERALAASTADGQVTFVTDSASGPHSQPPPTARIRTVPRSRQPAPINRMTSPGSRYRVAGCSCRFAALAASGCARAPDSGCACSLTPGMVRPPRRG